MARRSPKNRTQQRTTQGKIKIEYEPLSAAGQAAIARLLSALAPRNR